MSLRVEVPGKIDLLQIHQQDPETFPFLLESVAGHPQSGRFDVLFAFPGERLRGATGFAEFARLAQDAPAEPEDERLPFLGGWFLLMGYELAGAIEPRLQMPPSPFRLPDFLAVRCTAALIHDRERGVTTVLAESESDQISYINNVIQRIDKSIINIDSSCVDSMLEDTPDAFLRGVDRIQSYLREGDVFQVNLSRAWRGSLKPGLDYSQVYQQLRRHNAAPFAGLATVDGVAVLSSSPERLVQIRQGWVQTRPIAGTRPRGLGEEDQAMARQLIGSLKERAEHVMLIDLERNDLGRVCEAGSIEVSELMSLESYAHVHHIVSNVRGRLRKAAGPGEVLRAVFPGGTITGCPKVRAMEIISELEGVGRGPYTGSMGYLSRCGRMDTSILIRSLVVQDGQVTFRAGAGIVADSQPEAELAETRAKARGLLLALGAAV